MSQKEESGLVRFTQIRDVVLVIRAPGAGAKVFERAGGGLVRISLKGRGRGGSSSPVASLPAPQACVQRNWNPAAPRTRRKASVLQARRRGGGARRDGVSTAGAGDTAHGRTNPLAAGEELFLL